MSRIRICREEGCHNAATTGGYCRLHYLKYWRHIRDDKRKKAAKKLDRYIESVVAKHPDRYMEVIKKDLRSPNFGRFVDEHFAGEEDDELDLEEEEAYDEDIDLLIKQLKIEKGF